MKPEEIQHLLDLANWATPGPWEAYSSSCCSDMGGVNGPNVRVCSDNPVRHPLTIEDAEFIAAAREGIPKLAAHIESLNSLLRTAEGFHDVAVKERDFERLRVSELERIVSGLKGRIALNLQEEPSDG